MDNDTVPIQLVIRYTSSPSGISVLGWKRELRFDSVASLNAFFQHIGRGESFEEHDLRNNGAKHIRGVLSHARLVHGESLFSSSEAVFREQRRFIADVIEKLQSKSPNVPIKTQVQPGSFRIDYGAQYCYLYLVSPEHGVERKLSVQFNSSLQSLHLIPLEIYEERYRWNVMPTNSKLGALPDAEAEEIAARIKAEFDMHRQS